MVSLQVLSFRQVYEAVGKVQCRNPFDAAMYVFFLLFHPPFPELSSQDMAWKWQACYSHICMVQFSPQRFSASISISAHRAQSCFNKLQLVFNPELSPHQELINPCDLIHGNLTTILHFCMYFLPIIALSHTFTPGHCHGVRLGWGAL